MPDSSLPAPPAPPIDLADALRVAIDAARAAGALLREEFHREGGPRGDGVDHAEVDTEAEELIRARLCDAFPAWGYLGEETGTAGPDDAPARWLVDPNDGTAAFLHGHRGHAVSIGLVVDGEPVLGVVFAPTAPDDDGDLIAWAQGQPLTRNDAPLIDPIELPEVLTARSVVLVSQAAWRSPRANAAAVAPARFRGVPSVAYRLALLAVGEGCAATGLSGPTDWDIAGAHALVRAAGGELCDETGAPVRYGRSARDPRVRTRHVAAGALPVARALATRDWSAVFAPDPPDPLAERYPLAGPPRPGTAVRDAGLLRRAQGCLLGQLAGDALGGLVEFRGAESIAARYPDGVRELADGGTWNTLAGQPTDDSEMALMLARSLLAEGGIYRRDAALAAYRAWRDSHPFDMGGTTRAGLSGTPSMTSQANGSLMRASPLGVFGHALAPGALATLARADSRITHPHPACCDAVAAFVIAIAHAIRTGASPLETHAVALEWAQRPAVDASVRDALEAAPERPPAEYQLQQGWVLIALQNAFYQLLNAPNFEEGVVATVMCGGDTDTNAAIAGALLGAVHGRAMLPARWERALLCCRPLAASGARHPRPAPFWPVDARELAEQLVLAGQRAAMVGAGEALADV